MKKVIAIFGILIAVLLVLQITGHGIKARKFAVILQAGKESHEGMARAVHALLYSNELKEKGYPVVLIFDGAGTEWAEELTDPNSKSPILGLYKQLEDLKIQQVVCDYCAGAFHVKETLAARQCPLTKGYKGHPSIAQWVKKGYELIIL